MEGRSSLPTESRGAHPAELRSAAPQGAPGRAAALRSLRLVRNRDSQVVADAVLFASIGAQLMQQLNSRMGLGWPGWSILVLFTLAAMSVAVIRMGDPRPHRPLDVDIRPVVRWACLLASSLILLVTLLHLLASRTDPDAIFDAIVIGSWMVLVPVGIWALWAALVLGIRGSVKGGRVAGTEGRDESTAAVESSVTASGLHTRS